MITLYTLITLLAATMQGEAQVLNNDEAALVVFEVAANRVRHPSFPNDLELVLRQGFFGWRRIESWDQIEPRYVELATRCVLRRHAWNHGALYMLSSDDLEAMGSTNQEPIKYYRRGRWAVYLFEEWPR